MEQDLRQPDHLKSVPTITTGTGAEPPLAPSNCSARPIHEVYAEWEWCQAAQKLLRLLLPNRSKGCVCLRCLNEEIHMREKPNGPDQR